MEKKKAEKKGMLQSCETCEFFDWDEDIGDYICEADIDEDDMYRMRENPQAHCPFYKCYDEYKSVQKRN